jgi:hypothetical protein
MDPLAALPEPSQPPELAKKPVQLVPAQVDTSQHKLESFFKINAPRPHPEQNLSVMTVKTREELSKNPFIKFGADCETQAMKFKRSLLEVPPIDWQPLSTFSIIEKFKALKVIERGNPPPIETSRRLKHIRIHNSGMQYNGNRLEKTSRIINCKRPFVMDPTVIDYD